jgi:hypothetical protein
MATRWARRERLLLTCARVVGRDLCGVFMPMRNLPFPIFPPVDLCDAQDVSPIGAALIPAAAAKTAATTSVSITAAGFMPKNISVNDGDTVKWTNADTKNHQVVC